MVQLSEHPTVRSLRDRGRRVSQGEGPSRLDAGWLRQLCYEAGADDVGFVEIDRPEIADQREDILSLFPRTRTLVSIVCRMNREPVRSPARSVANLEFHHTGDHVNDAAHRIVAALEARGVRAMNPAMGFPMEMDRFGSKVWVVSHKPVAVAAGLGRMGIHRNVIHPRFGSFILLGSILLDAEVTAYDRAIDYNPCLECKLCVAACPVGAIEADGRFNFSACYTHNYREFMGGFTDWVERIVGSRSVDEYRRKVSDPETVSMWQSLSYGANYKSAYCLAVCPAGEDVIAPFLRDRPGYLGGVVKPLQAKPETVYVVAGSDAEAYVARRFPHKTARRVSNGLRPASIRGFLNGLPFVFQRHRSEGLNATYHFTFVGEETAEATVVIRDGTLQVHAGHAGTADLRVRADSRTWLGFLRKERGLVWALLRGKIRIKGSPRLLLAFGRCFPS
ncbi:MAG TPA: SCP2 sterol-binding domain-containing protein [Candidatus Methylomirabilis sp.]|nr:SCP2 sterol-binding domain-containing protein [Candidatus Methylomirabilis sp.]